MTKLSNALAASGAMWDVHKKSVWFLKKEGVGVKTGNDLFINLSSGYTGAYFTDNSLSDTEVILCSSLYVYTPKANKQKWYQQKCQVAFGPLIRFTKHIKSLSIPITVPSASITVSNKDLYLPLSSLQTRKNMYCVKNHNAKFKFTLTLTDLLKSLTN